jgi:hypothetical protein
MDEQRKRAYRYLLYWAMLDIRSLQWIGWRGWRSWNPFHWRWELRRVRRSGAVADWLHNLALYSSFDFQGFDEERFWRDFERFRALFTDGGLEEYRTVFEQEAAQSACSRSD